MDVAEDPILAIGSFVFALARRGDGDDVADPAMNLEDARDLRDTLNGDGEAYGRLVRRHQDRIGRYMWRFTRDHAAHEELVQDVFVEAYFSLSSYRHHAPLAHWLQRIATRAGYRYWKDRKRREARDETPLREWDRLLNSQATASIAPQAAAEAVHALLSELPPRDRLVLTLMYLEELSVEEIASLTGWTQSMVKVQAFRARGKLKELLDRQEDPS
jgi:RNA polymerase sigma-70 factor (ECF subfamily)